MYFYIHWNLSPDIPLPTQLFSLQWYGVMWTMSILGSFYLGRWILRYEKITEEHLVMLIQYIFIGAIIGARLGQVFFYDLSYFMENPLEIVKVWKGGLASHGGIVGGLVAIWLFQKRYPMYSLQWLLDRISLVIFLPATFIRLGNLCNSELYGKTTDVPWAFVFEHVDMLPRHAVVLYEAIAYFLLQATIIFFYKKQGDRPWFYVGYFFATTFTARFILEFWKEPEGALVLGYFSKTQLLSLPLILLGVGLLRKARHVRKQSF